MSTDKNTIIGIVLLVLLFGGFFYVTNKQQQAAADYQKHIKDSTDRVLATRIKPVDIVDSLHRDSATKMATAGDFTSAAIGTEQFTVVENEVIKVTFTNKGGAVKSVELKNNKP